MPIKQLHGSRFVRSILNKELALCAAVLAVSLCTASAQFTYTNGGTLTANATYDGYGVDTNLEPCTVGPLPVVINTAPYDDYITANAIMWVKSGNLTINDDDFKVGNSGTFGTLIVGGNTNANLTINNIGQWGGGVGWWTGNGGLLIISNNATLTWQIAGSSEQRFVVGGADFPGSSGTITLNGGSMTVYLGIDPSTISDSDAQFGVGCFAGPSGLGFLNLNAGTLTDALPLPFVLGGFYFSVTGSPTFTSGYTTNTINILNGTLVVNSVFASDPNYPDRASFTVGTNSYVNFIPGGTGSLSLTNWASTNYQVLVSSGQIRAANCLTTTNQLLYSSVNGMGILQVGPQVVAPTLTPNYVYAGTPIQLNAAIYGFTQTNVQWQLGPDGVTFTNLPGPGATNLNYTFDTSGYTNSATTNYYQLVAMNTGGLTTTSAVLNATINGPVGPTTTLLQSVTNYAGETALFSVTVTVGTPPFSYQWQFNGVTVTNGVYDSGADTATLTLNDVAESGTYTLIVTNLYGSATNSATITVLPAQTGQLVGRWLTGATNFADVSHYQPAGTHDGVLVADPNNLYTNAWFTNDLPPIAASGQSLSFGQVTIIGVVTNQNTTALVISNSSTADAGYTNTFDDTISTNFTVMFWAKGAPPAWSWNPWVSKNGDGGEGWQYRTGGANGVNNGGPVPCWTVRGNEGDGIITLGAGPSWSQTGDNEDLHAAFSGAGSAAQYYGDDNNWHFYTGTYDGELGIRNLYIDGRLYAQIVNIGPLYTLASDSHLMFAGKDGAGTLQSFVAPTEIYDVRIYNYVFIQSAVRNASGLKPSLNINISGANAVLNWSWGTLWEATSLAGPWTPVSTFPPYTNAMTGPQMFFRVSNP